MRVLGAGRDVNTLRRADIDAYVDTRFSEGASRHTIKKELVTLKLALKLARGVFRLRTEDLFGEFKDGYTPRRRWLTHAEFNALAQRLPSGRIADVVFIAFTGARLGEYERAQVGDIGVSTVFLRGTKTNEAPRGCETQESTQLQSRRCSVIRLRRCSRGSTAGST